MTTFRNPRRLVALAATLLLAACGSGGAPGTGGGNTDGNTLSGTVKAPPGADVRGTVVEACFVVDSRCYDDSPNTLQVVLQHGGPSALWLIEGLAAGQYGLFACKDVNADETCDVGDYYGFYTEDGQNPTAVTPPAAGLEIAMAVLGTGGSGTPALFPDTGYTTAANQQSQVVVDTAGITHLLYAGMNEDGSDGFVRYGECSSGCLEATSWRFATLGDFGTSGLGGGARLALNASGHPRALWYQQAEVGGNGAYYYAECDGGCTSAASWRVAPVVTFSGGASSAAATGANFALDAQGHPRFVFQGLLNGMYYAYCDAADCTDGNNWQLTDLDSTGIGPNVELAFDTAGHLLAAFEGGGLDENSMPIDVVGYASCDDSCGAAGNWQAVGLFPLEFGASGPFSLALSEQGQPRLAYFDGQINSLVYAWCDGGCTDTANWGSTATGLPAYSGSAGVDLVLDAAGNPVLAYSGSSSVASIDSAGLAYCTAGCQSSAPSWSSTLIETASDIEVPPPDPCHSGNSYWQLGAAPSLWLDAAGAAHVSYATSSGGTCPGGKDDEGNPIDLVFSMFGPLRYAEP